MRYRKLFLFLIYIVLALPLFSQIEQPNRFEKEWKFSEEEFTIIPLAEDGIALIRERNKYKSGNQFWDLILLDSSLQENKKIELEVDAQNQLIGHEYSPGFIHILFLRKKFKGEMQLFTINLKTAEINKYEINPELAFQITHFCKSGDNFIFGGYVNTEAALLLFNPSTAGVKVVPGFFKKNIELIDVRSNRNNQTFNTILIDKGDRFNSRLIFRTFDDTGKQLFESITDLDEDLVIQNGISSTLQREDLIVIGTWGKRNSKQASGFYTLKINPFEKQPIHKFHFGELTHYLDYLKPKKAATIKARTLKALEAGKIPDFTNYVIPYHVFESKNGFTILGESFLPSNAHTRAPLSGYQPYPDYAPYSPYPGYYPAYRGYNPMYGQGNNVSNDDNVKNVHGFVLNFDGNGNPISDFSIKFDNVKRSSLEQVADFSQTDSVFQIFYKKERELILKRTNLLTQKTTEVTENMRLKESSDEFRAEDGTGLIRHWFGTTFYAWGYQTIRNRTNSNRSREVFYINKVVLH